MSMEFYASDGCDNLEEAMGILNGNKEINNDDCVDRIKDPIELVKYALDFINRLQAENERLKKENEILSINADTAFQNGLNEAQDLYAKQVKAEIKSEAVKEFAEKLNDRIINFPSAYPIENATLAFLNGSSHRQLEILEIVDNLVKEMVGEKE